MSSPSFARSPAGSPPAPANATLPNPRKRPSIPVPLGPSVKRRKASTYSTASGGTHPLRQTSFPPDEAAAYGARSPSVDTDITQSVAASAVSGRQAGRKRKSAAPEGSIRSGTGAGRKGETADAESKADGVGGDAGGGDGDDEGDEDEEGDEQGLVEGQKQGPDEERYRYSMLFEAADRDQQERLVQFKRYHLNVAKVRKIVNQTLSQSVPASVVTAINSYTKYFVGHLIERAIEIQRQNEMAAKGYLTPDTENGGREDKSKDGRETRSGPEKEVYIGPLLPDSLREALRRYKRDGEGGGVGMEGSSVGMGMPGSRAAAMGGRRLFR